MDEHIDKFATALDGVVTSSGEGVKAADVAQETVIIFGRQYWPITDEIQFNYNYDKLAAARGAMDDIQTMVSVGGCSAATAAHRIRRIVGWFRGYGGDERVHALINDMTDAMEANNGQWTWDLPAAWNKETPLFPSRRKATKRDADLLAAV